ncbi:MAG TPA: tripartite tricarboxylate transporter substrate binding protein [Rhodobacteraceae bacterium]|nr:tripartite tricarboxylate transporter substrate binding protein [Paracoccaceae bacterium]
MLKKSLFAGVVMALGLTAGAAFAEYPEKSVTIIVPSKAGGSTDRTARLFTELAEKNYDGFEFVINNIPGSGGQKGFEAIARANPDGYTIGLVFTPQLVAHIVSGRAQYTLDSFHIMGNTAQDPGIVVVPKDSPITDMASLAEAAKANSLTVAVNGIGSDDFLAAKAFENVAGVEFNLLPTKGSTEQKAAILGGHVDAAFMNLSQMIKQHKAGDARIIAMLTEERDDHLPDMPTAKEQGITVLMRATRGFVAPAGIDPAIQDQLDKMLTEVMASDEFVANAKTGSIFLLPMSGADYLSYLQSLQAETQAVYDKAPW